MQARCQSDCDQMKTPRLIASSGTAGTRHAGLGARRGQVERISDRGHQGTESDPVPGPSARRPEAGGAGDSMMQDCGQ